MNKQKNIEREEAPKLLPLEYCTVERAARLLGCEVEDINHWHEVGAIELCVRLEDAPCCAVVHPEISPEQITDIPDEVPYDVHKQIASTLSEVGLVRGFSKRDAILMASGRWEREGVNFEGALSSLIGVGGIDFDDFLGLSSIQYDAVANGFWVDGWRGFFAGKITLRPLDGMAVVASKGQIQDIAIRNISVSDEHVTDERYVMRADLQRLYDAIYHNKELANRFNNQEIKERFEQMEGGSEKATRVRAQHIVMIQAMAKALGFELKKPYKEAGALLKMLNENVEHPEDLPCDETVKNYLARKV